MRRNLIFVSSIALLLIPALPAWGFSISPLTFEINVNPGEVITNVITLTNNDAFPVSVRMKAQDYVPVGEEGGVRVDESLPAEISARSWVIFDANDFVLLPEESRAVQFTMNVPVNAEPGGKYITIIGSTGLTSVGGSAVGTAQEVGALLLVRVAGDVTERLEIESFEAPDFLEYGPVPFTLRLKNTGTVHMKPAGFVFIRNARGVEVAKISLPQKRVLPNTIRRIDASDGLAWDVKWGLGKYTADLAMIYGGTANESLSASASFWIVPWKLLAGILVGLTALLLFIVKARHRLLLALKILLKGERSALK